VANGYKRYAAQSLQDLLGLLSLFRSNVGDVDHLPLRCNQLEHIAAGVENAPQFAIGRQMSNHSQLQLRVVSRNQHATW